MVQCWSQWIKPLFLKLMFMYEFCNYILTTQKLFNSSSLSVIYQLITYTFICYPLYVLSNPIFPFIFIKKIYCISKFPFDVFLNISLRLLRTRTFHSGNCFLFTNFCCAPCLRTCLRRDHTTIELDPERSLKRIFQNLILYPNYCYTSSHISNLYSLN